MKIDIACGGTGGHLLPGLVTGNELRRRGHDVTLWLTGRDIEREMTGAWDGGIETVPGRGFAAAIRAIFTCRRTMRSDRPGAVLAMGGYGSIGPAMAAKSLGVPVVLHEANVIPGRAARFIARFSTAVAVAFDDAAARVRHSNVSVTGMPLRPALFFAAEEDIQWPSPVRDAGLEPGTWTLLVLGGSQGAQRLNALVPAAAKLMRDGGSSLQVVHLAGGQDRNGVEARYREAGVPAAVFDFYGKMEDLYALADYAVCRAGAATCAELQALGLPALLVPYPHARDNHQVANAKAVAFPEHIEIALEATLEAAQLAATLEQRISMGKADARAEANNAGTLHHDAADRLANLMERIGRASK
jgi:UDP-N-acetylglucosamine--N-acetylmuramyl-(pentapeptide) pyrophosphoryl-undecaprenol N-acetylglucosamine transferase